MAVDDAASASPGDDPAVAEVVRAVEDYVLGWYDADPVRMRRALHPELAKRAHVGRDGQPPEIRSMTAAQMVGWTDAGEGRETDPINRRLAIVVDEVYDSIATARVDSVQFREFVHLARTPDGWRIVNTLYERTQPAQSTD
jgi:hypothetical protein